MLTPYELGQEVAQVQIQLRSEISISKATSIAHVLEICEADQMEFLEGYQNKFAQAAQHCDLCGAEVGEEFHDCPEPDPGDVFAQPISEFDEAFYL